MTCIIALLGSMQKEYYGNDACNSVDELNLAKLCPLHLDSQDYDIDPRDRYLKLRAQGGIDLDN